MRAALGLGAYMTLVLCAMIVVYIAALWFLAVGAILQALFPRAFPGKRCTHRPDRTLRDK
jgi:hypothetical protein